jgi:hypothetical protein
MSDTFWNGYMLGAFAAFISITIGNIAWGILVARRERNRKA